jgi:hypothetical protein
VWCYWEHLEEHIGNTCKVWCESGSSCDGHTGTISHGVGTMSHVAFGIWFLWMPHSDPLWVLLFWLGLGFSLFLPSFPPFVGCFVGLALQGKDIVFRFIIEYSKLMGFWPLGNRYLGLFLYEDFWKMIFWLRLKLEISYNRIIISWRLLVSFRGFFWRLYFLHGEIFEFP